VGTFVVAFGVPRSLWMAITSTRARKRLRTWQRLFATENSWENWELFRFISISISPDAMKVPSNPCKSHFPDATSLHVAYHSLHAHRLLELLLGAELVGMATLALAAVGRSRWQTSLYCGC